MGSDPRDRYYISLPVWAAGNCYFNGAKAWDKETDAYVDTEHKIRLELEQKDGGWVLKTDLYRYLPAGDKGMISTEILGEAFEPEQKFEQPDGAPILFDQDFFGKHRGVRPRRVPLNRRTRRRSGSGKTPRVKF